MRFLPIGLRSGQGACDGQASPKACCVDASVVGREKGRTKEADGEQQKIAENADGVFAPRVVVAVEVEDLAAVERECGVDGEDKAGEDAGNSRSAAGAPREKCEKKESGQAAGDDGGSGVIEREGGTVCSSSREGRPRWPALRRP